MIKIGDHVKYFGYYCHNFPNTGIVDEIKGDAVKIKLDIPVEYLTVPQSEVIKTEPEQLKRD